MRFVVPPTHPALAGHFPGNPIVPGVVLLARVVEALEAIEGAGGPYAWPQVKFARPLLPGEAARVSLESRIGGDGGRRWRFRVEREDGVLLASGEVAA